MHQTKKAVSNQTQVIHSDALFVKDAPDTQEAQPYIAKLRALPESIDMDRVMKIKQAFEEGTYSLDDKIEAVSDSLVDDMSDDNRLCIGLAD